MPSDSSKSSAPFSGAQGASSPSQPVSPAPSSPRTPRVSGAPAHEAAADWRVESFGGEEEGVCAALPLRRLLRRFSHLLILTALLAVPLAYPFQIPDALDFKITQWVIQQKSDAIQMFWTDHLQPALYSGYSPLTLKRIVWAFLTLFLAVSHALWIALPGKAPNKGERSIPWELFFCMGFIVWSGMSILFWLPIAEGTQKPGAGFLESLDAWSDTVAGIAFFLIASDMLKRRRWVYKGLGILIGASALISFLAIAQRQGWAASFLPRWKDTDIRNRMSSLIGHNTGVASFLAAPVLITLAVGFPRWRTLRKSSALLLAGFWLLLAMTLVMTQSRAILLLLLAIIPILLWKLDQTAGLSPSRSGWLTVAGGVLLVVILQILPWKWNPFYDKASPLTRRVHDLSWERLLAETRLRMIVCSGSLLASAPVQGHGFGSFQYVFPLAQGEYFVQHPGTRLVPTSKRSEHAHNEYLQTLIETGAVGLLLALAALGIVLRKGWGACSRTLRPEDIPIQLGIFAAIGIILIHAGVDFPLRVPPICITLAWLLAIWNAGDRIWLPRSGRLIWSEDDVPAPESSFPPMENAAESGGKAPGAPRRSALKASKPALRVAAAGAKALSAEPLERLPCPGAPLPAWRWAVWGAAGCAILLSALSVSAWFSRRLTSDVFTTRASRCLDTYGSQVTSAKANSRMDLLKMGRNLLRRSLRLRPMDGETLLLKGFMEYYMARESWMQAQSAQKAANPGQAELWKSDAIAQAHSAISSLNLCLQEFRYHQVFHLIGESHRILGSIENKPEDYLKAREYLEKAVAYTPSYSEAIVPLIVLLESRFPEARARQTELLSILHRWSPGPFEEYFLKPGHQAVEMENYARAAEIFSRLSEAVPNAPDLLAFQAVSYFLAGKTEKAEGILADLQRLQPRPVVYEMIMASIAIRRQEWSNALAYIEQGLRHRDGDLDYLRIMQFLVLEKLGRDQAARNGLAAMAQRARRDPQVYLDLVGVLVYQFGDLDRAIPYIRQRIAVEEPPPPPKFRYLLARWLWEKQKNAPEARTQLKAALAIQPDHGPSRQLLAALPPLSSSPPADPPSPPSSSSSPPSSPSPSGPAPGVESPRK